MAESQYPTQIEVARLIDAVQRLGHAAIHAQRSLATEKTRRPGTIGLLELVSGNGIANFTQREKASFHNAIEQLFGQLLSRDDLHQIPRQQADFIERDDDLGAKGLAEHVFRGLRRLIQDFRKLPPLPLRDAGECQSLLALCRSRETSTMRWFGNSRRIGRLPSDKTQCMTFDCGSRPRLIVARLLQIVEQPRLDRP